MEKNPLSRIILNQSMMTSNREQKVKETKSNGANQPDKGGYFRDIVGDQVSDDHQDQPQHIPQHLILVALVLLHYVVIMPVGVSIMSSKRVADV